MIRMLIFSLAVVVILYLVFPEENVENRDRLSRLAQLVEEDQLEPEIQLLRQEVAENPLNMASRRDLVELLLHTTEPRYEREMTFQAREVLQQSVDLEWFAAYLRHPNPLVRENTIQVCRNLRLVQMLPRLEALGHGDDADVRAAATAALGEMRPEEFSFLLRLATHDSMPAVRAAGVTGLARLGLNKDLRRLIQLVEIDPAPEVQAAAKAGLVSACVAENTAFYQELADSQEAGLARIGQLALASQGEKSSLKTLQTLISRNEMHDPTEIKLAARALAQHQPAVLERLLEELSLEPECEQLYQALSQESQALLRHAPLADQFGLR